MEVTRAGAIVSALVVTLPDLTKQIIAVDARAQASARALVADMIEAGRLLTEAKKMLPHGQFGDWCESELGFNKMRVSRYMRAYQAKGNAALLLTGDETLTELVELGSKAAPEEGRWAALDESYRKMIKSARASNEASIRCGKDIAKRLGEMVASEISSPGSCPEGRHFILTQRVPEIVYGGCTMPAHEVGYFLSFYLNRLKFYDMEDRDVARYQSLTSLRELILQCGGEDEISDEDLEWVNSFHSDIQYLKRPKKKPQTVKAEA